MDEWLLERCHGFEYPLVWMYQAISENDYNFVNSVKAFIKDCVIIAKIHLFNIILDFNIIKIQVIFILYCNLHFTKTRNLIFNTSVTSFLIIHNFNIYSI